MKKCLIDGCDRKAMARGLCHSCYQTAWSFVKSGRLTWEQSEKLGLSLPSKAESARSGSPYRSAVTMKMQALADALAAGKQLPNISGCCQLYGDPQADEDDAAHVANFRRIFGTDEGAAQ